MHAKHRAERQTITEVNLVSGKIDRDERPGLAPVRIRVRPPVPVQNDIAPVRLNAGTIDHFCSLKVDENQTAGKG